MQGTQSKEFHRLHPDIRDKLPTFARFRAQKQIIKDSNYYHTAKNDIHWNNKARMSEKFYPYYHKLADDAAQRLEQDRIDEIQRNKLMEELRIAKINQMKLETVERTRARKQERKLLQVKSHQGLSTKDGLPTLQEFSWLNLPADNTLIHKVVSAKHAITTENKWNYLLEADQKYVDHVVVPVSVKGEEQFNAHIQKRLEEEKALRELQKQAFKKKHDETRDRFLAQHERNFEFEKHCKLIPKNANVVNTSTSDSLQPQTATGFFRPQTSTLVTRGILKSREKLSTPAQRERSASVKHYMAPEQSLLIPSNKSLIRVQEGNDLDPIPKCTEPSDTEEKFFTTGKRAELKSIVDNQTSFEASGGFGRKSESMKQFTFKFGTPPTTVDATLANTVTRLAVPKSREFEPANEFDRVEYKGLWIKELDPNLPQSANNLTRTLTAKSSIYGHVMNSTRMSRRGASNQNSTGLLQSGTGLLQSANAMQIRPVTGLSKMSRGSSIGNSVVNVRSITPVGGRSEGQLPYSRVEIEQSREYIRELEDVELTKNEMDKFEEKYCGVKKTPGYPRVAFEKAKRLTSGQEYVKEMMG